MRARTYAVVALAAAGALAGYGAKRAEAPGHGEPANAPPVMGCQDGGRMPSPLTDAERRASVVVGSLTLVYARQQSTQPAVDFDSTRRSLRRLSEDPSSRERERRLARRTQEDTRPGSYGAAAMRIRVSAGSQTTVMVPAEHRPHISLIYTARARDRENLGAQGAYRVDDGDPAVTFRACPDEDTEFLGGFVVAGARCVPLRITQPGRPPQDRLLSFGAGECVTSTATPDAGRVPGAARRVLSRPPYMGLACPTPNSIACDRIGLAVWLEEPARSVTATIADRHLRLRPGGFGGQGPTYWEGYVQPAGLLSGPLEVTPDRPPDYWAGGHPLWAAVSLAVKDQDGSVRHILLRQWLAAGWG
ncbi:MAG: hypothetical protein MSC31_18170 [Solirubrobacteraceae bacterium MAG38_C4-C5]|nr:hypothetical protein [Candidatus Siliceabacter maunaloa]